MLLEAGYLKLGEGCSNLFLISMRRARVKSWRANSIGMKDWDILKLLGHRLHNRILLIWKGTKAVYAVAGELRAVKELSE